ncbi:MAG: ATP-binding protein, partial [Acutalibacteraceae bacterium]|nr:ATP-binding protein [Acutalibacteraceae bacterium]
EIFVEVYPDHIDIKMQDKGPGIENIEQAMQEGYSTAPANVRALGFGAGMGLPNIKKYTDGLRIESEVGKGTTIYMTVQVHES